MISSIQLHHFQSHKDTTLQLSSGVNVITGSSDQGKTSILRGLFWARYNRPSGSEYISFWNRNKDGDAKEETSVIIKTEKDTIKRYKIGTKNAYQINDNTPLEAIKQEVPDIVEKLFNLSDVNIQGEHDPPFLLSKSAGEVAKFFNKTIHLDLIDNIQSTAEIKRKDINRDIIKNEQEIKRLETTLKTLDWTDEADRLLALAERLDIKIQTTTEQYNKLTYLIKEYKENDDTINELNSIIDPATLLIEKIDILQNKIDTETERYETLTELIDSYKEQERIIATVIDTKKAEVLVKNIEELNDEIEKQEDRYKTFLSLINEYKKCDISIEKAESEIVKWEKKLPELCPTCNQPYPKDHKHD